MLNISNLATKAALNDIQDGLSWGCLWMGWGKKLSLLKICHTYSTMTKLGAVILYLNKIQKICESCDISLKFY